MKIIHELTQGDSAWHLFRADHYGASEASAVLGLSPYKTRDQVLHEKATGLTKEVDASTEKVFAKGHIAESQARPIVEKLIGMDLYPVTVSLGKLSASCDGLSMCETVAWETKQFNKSHFEQVKNGELPEIHWPQCQQVLYVTGAEKLYFTISDGTEDNTVGLWVLPDADKQQTILDSWAQFSIDLATYVPPVIVEKVEAETIKALPVPSVVVRGEIVASNLDEITPMFDQYLSEINYELTTDQQFADAKANAKNCGIVEDQIQSQRDSMISQMVTVKTIDSVLANYQEAFRKTRLHLDKAVKDQELSIKSNAVLATKQAYMDHVQVLEAEIAPIRLNLPMPDFAGSFKNVKSLDTMHSRLNDALANGKIAADAMARDIRMKLTWFNKYTDLNFLFSDLQLIITKPVDDFMLLVSSRVDTHIKADLAEKAKIKADAEAALLAKQAAEIVAPNHIAQVEKMVEVKPSILPESMQAEFGKMFTPALVRSEVPPSVNDVVSVVARAYGVDEMLAHRWLLDMNFLNFKKAA